MDDMNYYQSVVFTIPLPDGMTPEEYNLWFMKQQDKNGIKRRIVRHLDRLTERRMENVDRVWERMNP